MYTILVVEDDKSLLSDLCEMLDMEGYDSLQASNGEEALQVIYNHAMLPNLILSDIMMHPINGFELLHLLRNDPKTATVPFIFLTARSEDDSREQVIQHPVSAYIPKPFDLEELLETIHSVLEH